jgi:hypothetical protein
MTGSLTRCHRWCHNVELDGAARRWFSPTVDMGSGISRTRMAVIIERFRQAVMGGHATNFPRASPGYFFGNGT